MDSLFGVEFYGTHDGHCPHLVALDYDYDDPGFRAFVRERCDAQLECTRKRVERGIRLGFIQDFTWNDVLDYARDGSWICIDHVINAMKHKKVMDSTDDGTELRKNVFKGEEAKSFEEPYPTAERVIKVIRRAGGIAILAHPVNKTQYVEELVGYGLNGIEVCHPIVDEQTAKLALEAANTFGLYRSGGTDHTGAMSGCGGSNAVSCATSCFHTKFCCALFCHTLRCGFHIHINEEVLNRENCLFLLIVTVCHKICVGGSTNARKCGKNLLCGNENAVLVQPRYKFKEVCKSLCYLLCGSIVCDTVINGLKLRTSLIYFTSNSKW
jgi:hypothetical protein